MSLWQPELFEKAQAARAAEPARRPLPKYRSPETQASLMKRPF
jgi:hypothetical protein